MFEFIYFKQLATDTHRQQSNEFYKTSWCMIMTEVTPKKVL